MRQFKSICYPTIVEYERVEGAEIAQTRIRVVSKVGEAQVQVAEVLAVHLRDGSVRQSTVGTYRSMRSWEMRHIIRLTFIS